jgi:arsenite oxidase small subunit
MVAAGTLALPFVPGLNGQTLAAQVAHYPRMFITRMSTLEKHTPVLFNYPDHKRNSTGMLVKLGARAGGGLGPERDVVAFNTLCPHMGGPLVGTYQPAEQVLGPCPFHQSLYDLTRHGMIVSGHATESLPQVLLELEGDDIYAVGLLGLIYGRYDNLNA